MTDDADPDPPADPRRQRGLALARAKARRIRRVAGDTWLVPSQGGGSAGYVVEALLIIRPAPLNRLRCPANATPDEPIPGSAATYVSRSRIAHRG